MRNFVYSMPTRIFFGKESIKSLGNEIKRFKAKKVLLVYGKSSLKKHGTYNEIVDIFNGSNLEFFELSGIEPNPKASSVERGIEICRNEKIDFILAAGGGSVIDASKAIAAGYYADDFWKYFTGEARITNALPLGVVLTLAATGSETNMGAVVTNEKTNQKYPIHSPFIRPKFAVMDPSYMFTVPKYHKGAAVTDTLSHLFEQYFSPDKTAYCQDRMTEGVIKTVFKFGTAILEKNDDYESHSEFMWAASVALNNMLGLGKRTDWACHIMEHELSAYYDVTHGAGLAVLTPKWMKYVLNEDNLWKFRELGINVFSISDKLSDMEIAERVIEKTSEFLKEIGMPSTLTELEIGEEKLSEMAENIERRFGAVIGGLKELNKDDILNIYKSAL